MAGAGTQKRLLCVYQILREYTDEEYGITIKDIALILEAEYRIVSARRSLYGDIAALRDFGVDICMVKSHDTRYYLGSREFELAELKILIDLVQNSKFITKKKSEELITKIKGLTSLRQGRILEKQANLNCSLKTTNEQIYYNVDKLQHAIAAKKQVEFLYSQWVLNFGHLDMVAKSYRKNGKKYVVSPYGLIWNDDNYYLVAYDGNSEKIKHYRVDKMERIEILYGERTGIKEFLKMDFPDYKKTVFGMFGGEPKKVKIRFENSLVGAVADRFGKDVKIEKYDACHFVAEVDVVISGKFFGWLFAFGDKAKIMEPEKTVKEFRKFAKSVLKLYN